MRVSARSGKRFSPSLLIAHGSPRHYREGYGPHLTNEDISEITQMHPADVLVGSHTHQPLLRRWGRYTVLNTGSVGSPFNGDSRAQYLLLTMRLGAWVPEFRRVPYDQAEALRHYHESGLLDEGGLSAHIFYRELQHARSFLVPFLMWCEEQGLAHDASAWSHFQTRFAGRFKPPVATSDRAEAVPLAAIEAAVPAPRVTGASR